MGVEKEKEPDHDKATGLLHAWLRGEVGIAAPGLWTYEVANILGRALPGEAGQKMNVEYGGQVVSAAGQGRVIQRVRIPPGVEGVFIPLTILRS